MKYIISGTNRPQSRTLEISKIIQGIYQKLGEKTEIIDLCDVGLGELTGQAYSEDKPHKLVQAIDRLTHADGVIVVCPEYNGSMPGALKYFIDHWKYPDTFEYRPFALVGLGGRWGGLRPVEHLQGVFGYRNSYIYPVRVFLSDIWKVLKDGQLQDPVLLQLLEVQAQGFQKFVVALQSQKLDANSLRP